MVPSPNPGTVTNAIGAIERGTESLSIVSKHCCIASSAFYSNVVPPPNNTSAPPHLLPREKVEPGKLLEDQKRRVEVGVKQRRQFWIIPWTRCLLSAGLID